MPWTGLLFGVLSEESQPIMSSGTRYNKLFNVATVKSTSTCVSAFEESRSHEEDGFGRNGPWGDWIWPCVLTYNPHTAYTITSISPSPLTSQFWTCRLQLACSIFVTLAYQEPR